VKLRLLSGPDIAAALPLLEAIDAMRGAFAALSAGRAVVPQRSLLPTPEGFSLFMPAFVPGAALGGKIVSVFPKNAARGKPVVTGLVVLLDPESGEPCALLDGTFLTAWRTGAATGLATDLLARKDARRGALLGCGAQGRTQVLAMDAVRRLETIRLHSRSPESVRKLCEEMQGSLRARLVPAADGRAAVEGADIVSIATNSASPVVLGEWLEAGAHVNGIGSFTVEMREVDSALVARSRVFVDSRQAALAEAGDLVVPLREGATREVDWTELGEVVLDPSRGRRTETEVTFFKSVGLAVQDMAAAERACASAKASGRGREIEF